MQATYLARDIILTDTKKSDIDAALVPEGKFVPLTELRDMVARGEVNDGQSLAGLYLFEQWLARQE